MLARFASQIHNRRTFVTPRLLFHSATQQRFLRKETIKSSPLVKRGVRVALLIQDLQNNIILVRNKVNIDKEETYITQVPNISLAKNAFNRIFDDPREAINMYLRHLLIEADENGILPFSHFHTDPTLTDEHVLIYFLKVKRYYEPEGNQDLFLLHYSIDQIIEAIGSSVYSNEASSYSREKTDVKKQANLTDSISITTLSKYILERHEDIYKSKEFLLKLRYSVVSFLFGCITMCFLVAGIF
jgi:hypothetical protein